jgi:hypothetical protein
VYSLVALGLLISATAATAVPGFRVQSIPGNGNCSAVAVNELGEVIQVCVLGAFSNELSLWDGQTVQGLASATLSAGCSFHSVAGFNNSRQRLQLISYLQQCGTANVNSFLQYAFLFSGGDDIQISQYLSMAGLTGSGYFIQGGNSVWMGPSDVRRVPGLPAGVRLVALNDRMQSIYRDGPQWYRVDVLTGGVEAIHGITEDRPLLNSRGWVAGVNENGDVAIWDGGTTRVLGTPSANSKPVLAGFNDQGWIVGNSTAGFWLWDGQAFTGLRDLVSGVTIDSVTGLTTNGKIAITIRNGTSEKSAALLVPVEMSLQQQREPNLIFKPEAGPHMQGRGESFGCDAVTGWVIDRSRSGLPVPLEMYEDTRLIAAGLASTRRSDGSYGFRLPIPAALQDGQPHFVNVRFGGTATAVEEAWGTIDCAPPHAP